MSRIRVAGIVPINDGFAFMHRADVIKRKDFQNYYTFPGGGLEKGETLEEGTIREIKSFFSITWFRSFFVLLYHVRGALSNFFIIYDGG